MNFPEPPDSLGRPTRKSREENLSETATKQILRACPDPRAATAAVERAHISITRERGLSLESLREAGFPVDLRAVSVVTCDPKDFFERFVATSLYTAWSTASDRDLKWASATARGMVFHWVGWKVCVLHTLSWMSPKCGRLVLPNPEPSADGEELFIDPLPAWARAIGWQP